MPDRRRVLGIVTDVLLQLTQPSLLPASRPEDARRAAVLASLLVTWVTFVPSFLFVLLGAPYMERLRGNRSLSAALTGITAAVGGRLYRYVRHAGGATPIPNLFTGTGAIERGDTALALRMVAAWVITLPAAALVGAVIPFITKKPQHA